MTKKCKRWGVWILVATLEALSCSSSNNDATPTQTITIGGVIDQTGSAGPPSWSDAARLAAQQMNTALARAGSSIQCKLALADSTNAPAVAVQRAIELVVTQGAKGLIVDTSQDDVGILKLQYDPDPTKHLNVPLTGLVPNRIEVGFLASENPDGAGNLRRPARCRGAAGAREGSVGGVDTRQRSLPHPPSPRSPDQFT